MIQKKKLYHYLQEEMVGDLSFQDPSFNGMQVEGKEKIEVIATAVSASLEMIQRAIDMEVDLLITHHGLFWNRENPCLTGSLMKKVSLLLQKKISLFAYHLPLDYHRKWGNNWKAAADWKWENVQPFGKCGNLEIGVQGTFPLCEVQTFVQQLENYYDHPVHAVWGGKEKISSAALISGGAHREVRQAVKKEIDCYITGSFDEPIWHYAKEEGIHFFALGHSSTEKVGPRALADHLAEKFQVTCHFIDEENPF